MSYTSGFFDAIDQGGGDYDRVYSAATFAHYFSLLVKNGVFPDPSTGLQVRASSSPNMQVSVSPGSGWVNGYYITVPDDSPEVLTVPTANPSLSRYDSVIMGLNFVDREIQLYIKSGAVSASPSPVILQRDNDLYELELARISVGAGVASITQDVITDTRSDSTRCGIVAGMIDQIDTTDLFAQYDYAFQTWFADIQAQLSGNVATNLQNQINQLSSSKLGKSDMATDQEVADGINTTHWTNPKQVSIAAQTVQDVGTGKLIKTKLAISHFEGSTIEVPFSYNSDLEGYNFFGNGVYNGLIHLFGCYSSRPSSSSSWSYYACCIIVDPVLKQVVWKNTNLTNSTVEYADYLRPAYNTQDKAISSDGSVVAMRYNSGAYLMFDMKNRTCHYGIPINYLCGFFATDTFIGYFYADSTSNTRIHYKSRSSSGNSYSVRNLGIQLYNGYGQEYFAPIGVTGDSVLFYYRTSYTAYNLGKYTLSTDALQTGLGTVNSNNLYGYSALTTMDNKVFIYGTTPSGRGLFMVDPVASTVTPHIYSEAVLNSNYSFLNERFTAFYFGTYGELMYFVFPMHSGLSVLFSSIVRVMAINRNTGELDSYYDIPFNEAVIRYNSSEQEHSMNFSWFEKKLDGKLGYNGYSMLDISQGVHQVIKSKIYLYYQNSSLKQNAMLGAGAWGILGECSQVDFLCVSGASVSNGNTLTISVVNKKPIYQMIPS